MCIDKIDLDIYNRYRDTISRLIELEVCEKKEKVETTTELILYALLDINMQINKYNTRNIDIGMFYQLMIKIDFLLAAVEFLYRNFHIASCRKCIWEKDFEDIKKFRLYRSLTIAHPLETTRYEEYGFDDSNEKWCLDVKVNGKVDSVLFPELRNSDFIIVIKEKEKTLLARKPVYICQDIISIAYIALKHLEMFTDKINLRLENYIHKLKNTPIDVDKNTDITSYILGLSKEVIKRYPSEIIVKKYDNGKEGYVSDLQDALFRLKYTFDDDMREKDYRIYKQDIQNAVLNYAKSVQNMTLYEDRMNERLHNLLYPDNTFLLHTSSNDQLDYAHQKIIAYLAHSNERSVEKAKDKLEQLTYDGCKECCSCTNEEWGVIQLICIQFELIPFFSINFDVTDKELCLQYCTALYFANKYEDELDTNNPQKE